VVTFKRKILHPIRSSNKEKNVCLTHLEVELVAELLVFLRTQREKTYFTELKTREGWEFLS